MGRLTRNSTFITIIVVVVALAALRANRHDRDDRTESQTRETTQLERVRPSDDAVERAFRSGTSNVQVAGEGVVSRLLADDNDGSRHQRFILRLPSGRTLLVAHNIDLAPRIDSLREGDVVGFYGEYEWNDKGGVLHWTHDDPQGQHVAGWIEHRGRRYQ